MFLWLASRYGSAPGSLYILWFSNVDSYSGSPYPVFSGDSVSLLRCVCPVIAVSVSVFFPGLMHVLPHPCRAGCVGLWSVLN